MAERRTSLYGTLRVSVPVSFGIRYISPVVAQFMATHPAIRLNINVSDLHADLIGDDLDMAVRIGKLSDSTLIGRTIGQLPVVACCSPAYIERKGTPLTSQDLRNHDCLLYGREKQTGWEFMIDGAACTIDVDGPMLVSNGEFICDAVERGRGVALLPQFFVDAGLRRGSLVRILEPYTAAAMPVSVIYPRHRQGSRMIEAFSDLLSKHVGELSGRQSSAIVPD